jgi:hypothetical protein
MTHSVRLQCIWQSCHFSFKVKNTCDLAPTPHMHTTRMSCSAERQLYLLLSADGLQEGQIEKTFFFGGGGVTKGEEALASGRHADSCLPRAAPGVSPRHLPHQHPVWPPHNRSSFLPTKNSPPEDSSLLGSYRVSPSKLVTDVSKMGLLDPVDESETSVFTRWQGVKSWKVLAERWSAVSKIQAGGLPLCNILHCSENVKTSHKKIKYFCSAY